MTGDLDRLLTAAQAWRGRPMAIATVTGTWGSAPRPVGSHMLVAADGAFEGSVSGGCVEGEVMHACAEAMADGKSRRLHYGVANDVAWEVGLPCGGTIDVFVQPVSDAAFSPTLLDALAAAHRRGEGYAISTDLATGESRAGDTPGDDRFVNRYRPPRRLLIVGAVQIAQSLARYAATLDVTATLIDPRERFLTEARFPGVTLDSRWPDEAVAAAAPDTATAVVTLSHDPKIDDPALIAALAAPTGYIAALGSTRSHKARLERLAAAGVSQDQLSRIEAPAGLPIGAKGPAEIGLSVAAGMIAALSASA